MEKLQTKYELLTIQQMAMASGLSAYTLRYYERVGLIQSVGRDDAHGYRYYTQEDVSWVGFLKRLRATGMPIREILRYTELFRQGDQTISARLKLLKQHRSQVEEHLRETGQHLSAITNKIAFYEEKWNKQGSESVEKIKC